MKKKIKLILFILILILMVLILKSTFSKYANEATAEINEKVGQWVIKINGTDITTDGFSTNFNIDNFIWDWANSQHVKFPKVAPGMKGYFDLIIDPTDTDVSMNYMIAIDDSKVSSSDINIKITGISEINGKKIDLISDNNGPEIVTRIKKLEEIKSEEENKRLDIIRVYVEWVNDENNNHTDSLIGAVPNNIVQIPIMIRAIQYTGT